MSKILQDLSSASLVTAIEENLFTFTNYKWPRATTHDDSEICWAMTDIPSPFFNFSMRAKLLPEKIDTTIESVIREAKARNISLFWWTGPATRPSDLGEHLEGHGFVSAAQMPGMAVSLENLEDDLATPEGLTIQRVDDKESLKHWCQVLGTGFGFSKTEAEAYNEFMNYFDLEISLPYLGMKDNHPVAVSLLHLGAGVAGIYSVATLPEVRRHGIGAMMTLAPLRDARNRGYKAGILHSSNMGESVYHSLGFQEYCKIGLYLWSPGDKQEAG